MKFHRLSISFVFSVVALSLIVADCGVVYDSEAKFGSEIARRILHQPLFPTISAPPPDTELPPPSPDVPDQPFFPEVPSTPYQNQQPPPSPSSSANVNGGPIPTATQPSKPGKKVAIAISVGIVTLGMLSALAFFLYRHKAKHARESQKLVDGRRNGGSRSFREESGTPPSSFLYIGTVEPSRRSNSESNSGGSAPANSSPYRKLDSNKRSERYRPSPELQPLPPLSKPLPPSANSPSPSASPSTSDEESRDMAFYTPHGSSISNDDSYYTLSTRSIYSNGHSTGSVPHSKRTSPRARLATSAAMATPSTADSSLPEIKQVLIPSIKQKSPIQSHPLITSPKVPEIVQPPVSYSPIRPRLSSPPQLPSTKVFQAIQNDNSPHRITAPPPRPPPPPPPPPPRAPPSQTVDLSTPRKRWNLDTESVTMTKETLKKQQFRTQSTELKIAEEARGKSADSLEKSVQENSDESRTKLKPLHWDKVRASSDRATVWDQLKSSSFQINEDMIEHLFGCNSANSAPKEPTRRSVMPPVEKENRVLDPKKSQNIAILLRALNVTRDEVSEALLDGNPESLGAELLETLVKMAPTKEEEIKLREYSGDVSKLGTAERFLKTVLDIPFAFRRVEAMLYRANFDTEVKYLKNSFQILEEASEELKNSRLFLKLLEAVLRTGNRMNVGTNRGEAKAFKLETLLKLADVKGTDGKTTLLHFVVQEIIRSETIADNPTKDNLRNNQQSSMKDEDFRKQGLQVVAGLSRDLGNVKKAAGMDSDVLSGYVTKLDTGLEKVRTVLKCEKPESRGKFFESMNDFLKEAGEEISRVKAEERHALLLVKEVTEYFHGNVAKEEAHPLRIFMIVRDFLSVLDNVCKEVRTMHERTVMGSARSFRMPPAASLPVLNRYNVRQDRSSDDSSSP